ncbi:MAG: TonB-dependent receptor [Flavobacteriaceae bacterium]|nr:TonB-dependent receptor [Flavobacteriaceae bacterium]
MKKLFMLFIFCGLSVFAQKTDIKKDTIKLNEVIVESTRIGKNAPFTQSNISKKELKKRNLGQDIPVLLKYLPNIVITSDAGSGVGYTGIRVRGSDATRVNVTINGIPLNDSESQGTYWVDLPDFASSTQSIQLQRGVGTSTNGAGAFGASLNLLTDGISQNPYGEVNNAVGSYNTHKHTVKFSTGLLNKHFELAGRVGLIKSDGYVDRASSDLKSFYLSGTYTNDKTLIKALAFGGHEITYQAWWGIDAETLKTNRTFNYAGAIYDDAWNVTGFYRDQVDNYKQDHYQLHINHSFNDFWSGTVAFHYTKGKGYYEEYQQGQDVADYGLTPISVNGTSISNTDLVRRKWLDNDFYGSTFSLKYNNLEKVKLIFGGAWNSYKGNHFGRVISGEFIDRTNLYKNYYFNVGDKTDFNIYSKINYQLNDKLSLYGDVQFRTLSYTIKGVDSDLSVLNIKDNLSFFNPKVGLNLSINDVSSAYLSYAKAHKEPGRSDYRGVSKLPNPENLDDFELGYRLAKKTVSLNANVYYMRYKDQLVLTGAIDDVGNFIRANSGKSYRLGLELDAQIKLGKSLFWQPNLALSTNRNIDFKEINGTSVNLLGNTSISFSPNSVVGNALIYEPTKIFSVGILSKYVGEQFMNNIELQAAKLPSYFSTDVNFTVNLFSKNTFREISITGLLNNILDKKYVSNGYMWGTSPYYYPQAGINFLLGLNLKF